MLAGDNLADALVQLVDIHSLACIGLFDIRRDGDIVVVLRNFAVLHQSGEMRIVLAGDERIENTRDVRIGELVFVALVDKLVRGVDKERRVILLALFQNNDAGGDADPEKEVGGQLDDGCCR